MTRPPERLRLELEAQRARCRPFRTAYPIAINVAVADLTVIEATFWRQAFAEQVWAAAFSREPWPSSRRPSMFIPEREHREQHVVAA